VTAGDLEATGIERRLRARGVAFGMPLSVLSTTASTNDDAKRAGQQGWPSGAAFVADSQSAGRGRLGRTWHSPPGQNLYLSFLLRPRLEPRAARLLTLAAGLAVRDAIAPLLPECAVGIKWPNDVYVDGRKLSGILAEAQLAGAQGFVVVGIGVNVRATEFPAEIRARATSLALAGARTLDRGEVFVEIAVCLQMRMEQLEAGAVATIVGDAARHDVLLGRVIRVDGEPAVALGLAADGALRIRRKDGSEGLVNAGEVQPSEPGSGAPASTN
jgi:BirA family biotin operon repressor/biotin-[acetyl-CoA-carboxylase] ligase